MIEHLITIMNSGIICQANCFSTFSHFSDIFESFLDHPPLILPNETPRLDLSQPIPSPELQKEVTRLRTFLWGLDQDELPANQRTRL